MKNNKKSKLKFAMLILVLITTSFFSFSQTTDLARVEYLYMPFSKSNNSINRYRALIQAPIPINKEKKTFLVIGLEYRYVDINIQDIEDRAAFANFGNDPVGSVQRMDGYLGYTFKISELWRIGAKAGISVQSNLETSPSGDDFIYDGAVYLIRDNDGEGVEKPSRLILGLTYSTTPGRNFPLPLVNFNKEFHPNWTYTIGVPKTNIRHYLNDNHKDAIQAFATLDNFFGNIQNNFLVEDKVAANISMTTAVLGLGYEHFFTKHLLFYAYGAHSVYTEFRLRDPDGENVYTINEENSFYFRTGIKFKY
jgi:hypothetical protein